MTRRRRGRGAVLAFLAFAGACGSPPEEPAPPPSASTASPDPSAPTPRFERFPLAGESDLPTLIARFGGDGYRTILRLNRIDASHAWLGDTLVVADPLPSPEELSPFPHRLPALQVAPKAILVSLRVQAWAAYAFGRRLHWGPTSTGKAETPTCPDLYYTNWKSRERRSTDNPDWLLRWVFNFENASGCSFHVFDLPGRPASHSCVRLLEEDAQWIYQWADQWILTPDESRILRHGTPVVIFGEYDAASPPPWKRLPEDPDADRLDAAEIAEALAAHAYGEALASRTREGLRVVAELDSLPASFEARRLAHSAQEAGPFVLDRVDLLTRRAIVWSDADRRADFDSLRAAFAAHGFAVRRFRVDGTGRALRAEGIASFVSPLGERLFYIESLEVPGLNADSVVWARYDGLVSVRGTPGDPHDAFRVILSTAEGVGPELR